MSEQNTVNIHGGNVNGPIAVGHQARAVMTAAQPLVQQLGDLIDEHEAQVADPALARRDVRDIGRELAEPEPDRDRVLDALKRLSRRAAEVTVIVDVIGRIRDLLP